MEFQGIAYIRLIKYKYHIQKKIKIPLKVITRVTNFTKNLTKQYLGNPNTPLVSPYNYDIHFFK